MSVVESIEEAGLCRKKLTVAVPAPAVEAEVSRVESEYRSKARIPGFRKGKIPIQIIRQRFSEDIKQDVIERLVPRYWHQAQAETEIRALLPPNVESVDFKDGSGLKFVATVEIRPEIKPIDLKPFDLPDHGTDPTDKEVTDAIEDIRGRVASRIEVERPAAQGDTVAGKLSSQGLDAESPESGQQNPVGTQLVEFEVGDESVWEELSLAVTGRAVGQMADFERKESESDSSLAKKFNIEITAVKERVLADLDDAFAARLGKFESFEDFRSDVRARVHSAKEQNRRHLRERALLDQLRDRHKFGLPEGVVHREIELLLREYSEELAAQGADLNSESIDWKQLREEAKPQAERRVHARLVLDAVAEEMKLEVSEAEFESAVAHIAASQGKTPSALRHDLDKADKLTDLRLQMRRQKVITALLEEGDEGDESKARSVGTDTDSIGSDEPVDQLDQVES